MPRIARSAVQGAEDARRRAVDALAQEQKAEAAASARRDAESRAAAAAAVAAEEAARREAQAAEQGARAASETEQAAARADLVARLNRVLPTRETDRGIVAEIAGVQFATGKAALNKDAQVALARFAGIVGVYRSMKLLVEGHTDSTGSDELNRRLSYDRAITVRDYLITQGVDASSIDVEGLGPSRPVDTNDTSEGRARNRRVEIILTGDTVAPDSLIRVASCGAVACCGPGGLAVFFSHDQHISHRTRRRRDDARVSARSRGPAGGADVPVLSRRSPAGSTASATRKGRSPRSSFAAPRSRSARKARPKSSSRTAARASTSKSRSFRIPRHLGPFATYVLWAVTADGNANNIGSIDVKNGDGELEATTPLSQFALIVSAEPHFAVTAPSRAIVLQNLGKNVRGEKFNITGLKERIDYSTLSPQMRGPEKRTFRI